MGFHEPINATGYKFPELYKLGNSSYFSESDYSLDNWKNRYWGDEIVARLEKIKTTWDPELVFTCHHCIGSDMTPRCGDETSFPPRTSCLQSVRALAPAGDARVVVV